MTASTDKPKIYGAMLKILTGMDVLPKGDTAAVPGQKPYQYRSIDDLLQKLHPLLVSAKVMILPALVGEPILHYRDQRGMCFRAAINVKFTFVSLEDGSTVDVGPVLAEGCDGTDKAPGKAHSAAIKIALYQAFAVPVAGGSIDPEAGEQDYALDHRDAGYRPPANRNPNAPKTEPLPPAATTRPVDMAAQTAAALAQAEDPDYDPRGRDEDPEDHGTPPSAPQAAPQATSPPPAAQATTQPPPGGSPPQGHTGPSPAGTNPPRGDPGHLQNAGELDEIHKKLVAMAGGSEPIACGLLKTYTQFQGTNRQTGQPELVFKDHFKGQYLSRSWLFKTLQKVRDAYDEYLKKGGKPI